MFSRKLRIYIRIVVILVLNWVSTKKNKKLHGLQIFSSKTSIQSWRQVVRAYSACSFLKKVIQNLSTKVIQTIQAINNQTDHIIYRKTTILLCKVFMEN